MIALAGNFYVCAPCITAYLAAVLLAVWNIAAAWNVRAFLVLLVYHGKSSDRYCSGFSILWRAPVPDVLTICSAVFWDLGSKISRRPGCLSFFEVQTLIADSFLFRRQFDSIGLFRTIAIHQTCKIIRVDRIR